MTLRQRIVELTEPEHVDTFLEQYPTSAFFKAGTCHKTMQAFGNVEDTFSPREDLYLGYVKVVEARPTSNYIAELTGITHESPQVILMIDKKPVFDSDNWDITAELLDSVLTQHFGAVANAKGPQSSAKGDVSEYVNLLEQYTSGDLSFKDFEQKWLMAFQMDASPRSTSEFELINGLFGDVDEAVTRYLAGGERETPETAMRDKAHQLLESLKNL